MTSISEQPRLVVFAGPNGSGKSTITRQFQQEEGFPLNYINPDVITAALPGNASNYLERSRQAQQIAEQQRQDFITNRESFAFETVMSHPSKIAIMEQAKEVGYHVTLVFVSTDDPQLNVNRVARRVQQGGHDVPADKIVSRYERTLELLPKAIEIADQAIVYDNSQRYLQGARLQNGVVIEQVGNAPAWINQAIATVQERAEERTQLIARETEQNRVLRDAKLYGVQYQGIIQDSTCHYAVQQIDESTLILHEKSANILTQSVEVGQVVQITYREGVGTVEHQQSLEQQNNRTDNEGEPPPSAPVRPRPTPQTPSGGLNAPDTSSTPTNATAKDSIAPSDAAQSKIQADPLDLTPSSPSTLQALSQQQVSIAREIYPVALELSQHPSATEVPPGTKEFKGDYRLVLDTNNHQLSVHRNTPTGQVLAQYDTKTEHVLTAQGLTESDRRSWREAAKEIDLQSQLPSRSSPSQSSQSANEMRSNEPKSDAPAKPKPQRKEDHER